MNRRDLSLQILLLSRLIVALLSCAQATQPPDSLSASSTPGPLSSPTLPPTLAATPEPVGPLTTKQLEGVGPLQGATPIWTALPLKVQYKEEYKTPMATPHGWLLRRVLWVFEPGFRLPVIITGKNLEDGSRMRFTPNSEKELVVQEELRLILAEGQDQPPSYRLDSAWADWYTNVYFPKAGCYQLEAQIGTSTWRMVVAFGV